MAEQKYYFDNEEEKKPSKLSGFLEFLWNSRTKEFCGRDGMSWAKVSLFYGIFYLCLGSFFVGMLAVLAKLLPEDRPTYYGVSSVMNTRGLNPGLGFRPQVDVEDYVIKYNPKVFVNPSVGLERYKDNLRHFLRLKYPDQDEGQIITCRDSDFNSSSRVQDFKMGKACRFDYDEVFKNTPCTEQNGYGYTTNRPCVLIKLNKIVSWEPETTNGYIHINCSGEFAFDKDNVEKVEYYSEGSSEPTTDYGRISAKYYPFLGQKQYRAPFIWARFTVKPNTYVNVECKAFAANIDNDDRLNRRGQTKFALYITNQSK